MAFIHLFSIFKIISKWFWALLTPPQLPEPPLKTKKSKSKSLEDLIQIYVEEAEVDTLKTLREMNSTWNNLAIKELEKRSEQDQLKQLVFSKEGSQEDFGRFLENTRGNPQLFHSFRFKFPESFKFIDLTFFIIYKPKFLCLKMNQYFNSTDRSTQYLVNFFSWISPTLEKLIVKCVYGSKSVQQQILPYSPPAHFGHLVFPKLTTLIFKDLYENGNYQFNFILDRSRAFDPTPNLTSLSLYIWDETDLVNLMGPQNSTALSRWSKLINLTIDYKEGMDYDRLTDALVSLSQAGMSLKMLKLHTYLPSDWIQSEKMDDFFSNLSHFLGIQSKSLQVLDLSCIFKRSVHATEEDLRTQIRLPIFGNVHTLHLDLCYEAEEYIQGRPVHTPLFEMGPLQAHFPKLDHLDMSKENFLAIYPSNGVPVEPIPLKSLDIQSEFDNFDEWSPKFTSLEKLTCSGSQLRISFGNAEMPWKETLKLLEIYNVEVPIKVSHLTNLRKLIVNAYNTKLHEEYLTNFDQVLALKLSEIIFQSCDEPSDEVKARFIRHFPFPVKFQKLPNM